jgi:hypothetical protein
MIALNFHSLHFYAFAAIAKPPIRSVDCFDLGAFGHEAS